MNLLTLPDVCGLESQVRESLWVVATLEGLGDLDGDELLMVVRENLKRGVTYRVILPDNEKRSPLTSPEQDLPGSYQVRSVPAALTDMMCPFQIHDAGKRARRGFYSHRAGPEYGWLEMDRDILEAKIRAFEYLWDMPHAVTAFMKPGRGSEAEGQADEFDELLGDCVQDPHLRSILSRDHRSSDAAYQLGLWKLSYVCCMGVVETLLDELLLRSQVDVAKGGGELCFAAKISAARSAGLLHPNTANMTHNLRDIRNVVHPRAELRSGVTLSRQHVDIARAFLVLVLKEWSAGARTGPGSPGT